MRFITYKTGSGVGLALSTSKGYYGILDDSEHYPGSLQYLLAHNLLVEGASVLKSRGENLNPDAIEYLPPLRYPSKIICVGLNYAEHAAETQFEKPLYPVLFARFSSTLVGHEQLIIRPYLSEQLDYEGELVAVIGKTCRHLTKENALDYVAGYSIFNDASVRDYQFKSLQWTMGKNFDCTGSFGPEFVTEDELPTGASGLRLTTRLNGEVMQSANTNEMMYDVAELIATITEGITLFPGDIIVTGTPGRVGYTQDPPIFMKHGDLCKIQIEGIGVLSNRIADEMVPKLNATDPANSP